jgi:hypothetical protein
MLVILCPSIYLKIDPGKFIRSHLSPKKLLENPQRIEIVRSEFYSELETPLA